MSDRHQGSSEQDAVAVSQKAVGDESAEHGCEVAETEKSSIDQGRLLLAHHQGIHDEECEQGSHSVEIEAFPHFGSEEYPESFGVARR